MEWIPFIKKSSFNKINNTPGVLSNSWLTLGQSYYLKDIQFYIKAQKSGLPGSFTLAPFVRGASSGDVYGLDSSFGNSITGYVSPYGTPGFTQYSTSGSNQLNLGSFSDCQYFGLVGDGFVGTFNGTNFWNVEYVITALALKPPIKMEL